jgi:hypothetical protein
LTATSFSVFDTFERIRSLSRPATESSSIVVRVAGCETLVTGDLDIVDEIADASFDSAPVSTRTRSVDEGFVEVRRQSVDAVVWPFDSDRIRSGPITLERHRELELLIAVNEESGEAYVWYGHEIPSWERSAPLRRVLHLLLAKRGVHLLHAGVLSHDGYGILIPGKGGSGKSTTVAYGCQSGWQTIGDDFIALSAVSHDSPLPEPIVSAMYRTFRLAAASPAFSLLNVEAPNPTNLNPDAKVVGYLDKLFPGSLVPAVKLCASVVPKVCAGQRHSTFTPASRALALQALAPSSLLLAGGRVDSFRPMTALVSSIPAFTMAIGSDVGSLLGVLSEILDAVRGNGHTRSAT